MDLDFQSQLKLLLELQEIDLKLFRDRATLDRIPADRQALENEHNQARAEFDTAKAELVKVEHQRRLDEMELAASVDHLQNREAKLYAIKTNKEYQAAIKEISEARRQNKEREDRILLSMEKIETLTKKITQLESDIADKEVKYQNAVAELESRVGALKSEMQSFEARRPELTQQLDKDVMLRYDSIGRRYPDAVVPVANGVCSGCTMRVPPQLSNEVLRGVDFKACPSCHRLIFVAPKTEETAGTEAAV